MPDRFSTIQAAVEAIATGKVVIELDEEDRENEGDFVCAADRVTPEMINCMLAGPGPV
ncbi:MAG: 3,4-dihydroxy-2-butanone-4-phosphate synthase, partial [Pirellula sp.]